MRLQTPKVASATVINMRHADLAWRMVIELVTGLGIGFGIGYGLDRVFGTLPVFLILFLLLGLAAGIKVMLKTADELQRKAVQSEQGDLHRTGDDTHGDGS